MYMKYIGSITLPTIPSFDLAQYFRVTPMEERETAELVIAHLDDNALRLVHTFAQTEVVSNTLHVHQTEELSCYYLPIAKLGGPEVATTALPQMYELMKAQGRGQEGILQLSGGNIFYVPDIEGTIWEIYCVWDRNFWIVFTNPPEEYVLMSSGCLVFSR